MVRAFRRLPRRVVGLIGALLLLGVFAGGLASASIPDSGGSVHTCYPTNGPYKPLYLVDAESGVNCPNGFTPLALSQTGAQGPQGPQGPRGPRGKQGPAGPPGESAPLPLGTTGTVYAGFVSDLLIDAAAGITAERVSEGRYVIHFPPGSFTDLGHGIGHCRIIPILRSSSHLAGGDPTPFADGPQCADQDDGSMDLTVFTYDRDDRDGTDLEDGAFYFLVVQLPPEPEELP